MEYLNISNYKCLEKIQISGLKKVNLFTGKNNTGKSTILEAISLFAYNGNFLWMFELLEGRGEVNNYRGENVNEDTNIKLLSTFFNNRNISVSENSNIEVASDIGFLSLRFVKFIEEDVYGNTLFDKEVVIGKKRIVVNEPYNTNFHYGFEIKNGNDTTLFPVDKDLFRRRASNDSMINCNIINAKGYDILSYASLWDRITLSAKEVLVIDALKIIEPKITGLSFIGEDSLKSERYPIVKLEGSPNLYPLKAMGDGVNRILNFILALVNSDNGFLLIDEFENGLHYSVQEKLWEIIFEISNRLNVQVFATTHSNDTINSFARVLGKSKGFEGSLYRLDRKGDEVRTYMFPEEEIKEAAIQHINMR